jgi:pimeloyl-[acyl-carrier protein] methyl ester esterase
MKSKLYPGNSFDTLVVFFAGWGMCPYPFLHLYQESGMMILYDYQDIELPTHFYNTISLYKNVSFIAWSFGVWVCAQCLPILPHNTQHAIAIAGTLQPADDTYGISPRILQATLDTFSEETRNKFYTRMCGDETTYSRFLSVAPRRTVNNQKNELAFLLHVFEKEDTQNNIFTHAIVCTKDTSFPARHQKNFWLSHAHSEIPATHFPFFLWNSTDEIINYAKQY